MQGSLPAEATDRNIKAADIADSAEVAKIVEIATLTNAQSTGGLELECRCHHRPETAHMWRSAHYLCEPGNGTARASFARKPRSVGRLYRRPITPERLPSGGRFSGGA